MLEPKMIEPTPLVGTEEKPAEKPVEATAKPEAKPEEKPAEKPAVEAKTEEPKVEAKPAEAKPTEEKKAEEKKADSLVTSVEPDKKPESKPEEKPEPITYEAFKLPDGLKLDEAESEKFTGILGKHHVPQEAAQELIDLYVSDVQRLAQAQREVWNKTQEDWKASVRADSELGGNRIETVLKTANSLIHQYGGTAEEKTALRQALALTGAGNHPEIVRFLYRVGKALAEPPPVPAPTPTKPAPTTRAQARYGANGAAQQGT